VAGNMEVFVPLGAEVDLEKLKGTLVARVQKLEKGVAGTEAKLANKGFVERADPAVVEAERERRDELALELEMLQRNLAGI